MREDELQVLGKQQEMSKRKKWAIGIFSVIAAAVFVSIGFFIHRDLVSHSPEWEEKEGTTIISALQEVVDSLLNDKLTEMSGLQGQVIIMEVNTGAIRAMVGFERRFDGKFQHCSNFAFQQEPGSTMKTAALLALLETGEVKLTDEVDTGEGVWAIDDEDIIKDHNWHRGGYGKITLERALEISSNIGISKTIRKVFDGKEQRYFELLDKMSLGQPDSIEGIAELKPMVYSSPKDSTWASRQLLWNSIGYERKMAPIQTLTFYNAIANDGKMVKPMLRPGKTEVINEQIASKENIAKIQQALYNVVCRGLGKKAGSEIIPSAGKPGTTQVNSFEWLSEEGYGIDEYHMSFCGYFPAMSPKYSIIVSMNKLGIPASGGSMAGPVFHDIMEWMVAHRMVDIE